MQLLKLPGFEDVARSKDYKPKAWLDFTPPSAEKIYNVLSYGGGQQTFAMLLLVETGLLPAPDLVIFADTGGEQPATYQHIKDYAEPLCQWLEIPFVRVSRGNLYNYLWSHKRTPMPPTCTTQFKIAAINAFTRRYFNCQPGLHSIDSWIGISTDEESRAESVSGVAYIRKTYPLLSLGMSRADCQQLIKASPYLLPPKSGCTFCPYRNWERIFYNAPRDFDHALQLEKNSSGRVLPMYGRSLQKIAGLPGRGKSFEDLDNCATGACFV